MERPLAARQLDDTALARFAKDFRDWEPYAAILATVPADGVRAILDVGGGNGTFLDRLLAHYPQAQGVLVDNAGFMIERNAPHPRKRTILRSAESIATDLVGQRFDLITVNVLLHHLVTDTETTTRREAVAALCSLRALLSPQGRLVVYEQVYDGWMPGVDPGALIFAMTRIRNPWLARVFKRMGANTAGVGVRFRSCVGWREVFREAGLAVERESRAFVDRLKWPRAVFLTVRWQAAHLFLLRPENVTGVS